MTLKEIAEKGFDYIKNDPAKDRYIKEVNSEYDIEIRQVDERTQINTGVRKFFYKPGCGVCKQWRQVIQEANFYLDPNARIEMINVKSYDSSIRNMGVDSAPTLFIDGIKIMGASTEPGSAAFIKGLLEDEMSYGGINPHDYI